jgi:hypothetical protein
MKRKIISLSLALLLCVGLTVPAFAATGAFDIEIVPSITVDVPGATGLTATLTNVLEKYQPETAEWGGALFTLHYEGDSSVSFNRDVTVFAENHSLAEGYEESELVQTPIALKAGEALSLTDSRITDFFILYIESGQAAAKNSATAKKITFTTEPVYIGGMDTPKASINDIKSTAPVTPPVSPDPAPALTAKPTSSTVLVNGKNVAFDAYNIGGNNYFKLRDLAYSLNGSAKQIEVSWDGAKNAISLTSGKAYTAVGGEMTGKGAGDKSPTATSSKIYLDGKEVTFTAYNIGGNNYFKLRDIGAAFDFGVDWDGAKNTIVIDTGIGYTPE